MLEGLTLWLVRSVRVACRAPPLVAGGQWFWRLVGRVRRSGSGVGADWLGESVASFLLAASRGQFFLKRQPFSRFRR